MKIVGVVVNKDTGLFVKGASVKILTTGGIDTGMGFVTNDTGSFAYEIDPLAKLKISHVGFAEVIIPANMFAINGGGYTLQMQPQATSLDEVFVTAKLSKGNVWLYLIGAAIVAKIAKLW